MAKPHGLLGTNAAHTNSRHCGSVFTMEAENRHLGVRVDEVNGLPKASGEVNQRAR